MGDLSLFLVAVAQQNEVLVLTPNLHSDLLHEAVHVLLNTLAVVEAVHPVVLDDRPHQSLSL